MVEVLVLDSENEKLIEENNSNIRQLTKVLREFRVSKDSVLSSVGSGVIASELTKSQKETMKAIGKNLEDLPLMSSYIQKSMNKVEQQTEKLHKLIYDESGNKKKIDLRTKSGREIAKQYELSQNQLEALYEFKNELESQKQFNRKDIKLLENIGLGQMKQTATMKAGAEASATASKGLALKMGKIGLLMIALQVLTKPIQEATSFMKKLTVDRIKNAMSMAMEPLNGVLDLLDSVLMPLFMPFFLKLAQGILAQMPKIEELVEQYQDKFTQMADDLIERVIPALPTLIEAGINFLMLDWATFIGLLMITIPAINTVLVDYVIPTLQSIKDWMEGFGPQLDKFGEDLRNWWNGISQRWSEKLSINPIGGEWL